MSSSRLLRTKPRGSRPRRPSRRLELEPLEERSLPSCTVSLAPGEAAPQLVGGPVVWTATATDCGAAPVYQFSAAPHGGALHVVRDFSPANSFTWTPMQEGTYDIAVTVKDGYAATGATTAAVTDDVATRVTGSQAMVTPTANPLVALYSVPPTSAATVVVQFAAASDRPDWRDTNLIPTVPGKSTNVFVAGMRPGTTYEMRHVLSDGTGSPPLSFTTGALPTTLNFPAFSVPQPPAPGSDSSEDLILHHFTLAPSNTPHPVATDLAGTVVWYYDVSHAGLTRTYAGQSLAPGGTVLLLGVDRYAPLPATLNVLREIDLAGNAVRETSVDAVNAQLTALGYHATFTFTHDVERLPNGGTAVICPTERIIAVHGTPTEYVGASIVVLDKDFQVAWAWDAFDHLDVNRGPILGEILPPGGAEQMNASTPILPAVDWLHVNSVNWSPADGNLVLSIRHQDWVIKIDYANGAGDGHVVWRLGQGGDFTVNSAAPNPWFSHQHDAHYIDDHTLILFDNGNTRRVSDPTADSRGQVWKIDERAMTATLVVNADLGNYSMALGAAERLSNGDFVFTSGFQGTAPQIFGQSIEVRPDGSKVYVMQVNRMDYRSFRVRTLYEGVDDALAGAPPTVASVVFNDGSAQRSMIDRITVTFSGPAILGPGAIELHRQDGSLVNTQISIAIVNGRTVAVLTFAGPEFVGGSLADGRYTLTVRADLVHDRWGRELDGDGDGSAGGDRLDGFFRLFGDGDGDGDVDAGDLRRLLRAFRSHQGDPNYLWYFDYDGNGAVAAADLLQLAHRIGGQ